MTCPGPDPDVCTDMTACPSCPFAGMSDDEVARVRGWDGPTELDECLDVAPCVGCADRQERAWSVGRSTDNSTQRNSPADLAEDRAAATSPRSAQPEGRPLP